MRIDNLPQPRTDRVGCEAWFERLDLQRPGMRWNDRSDPWNAGQTPCSQGGEASNSAAVTWRMQADQLFTSNLMLRRNSEYTFCIASGNAVFLFKIGLSISFRITGQAEIIGLSIVEYLSLENEIVNILEKPNR